MQVGRKGIRVICKHHNCVRPARYGNRGWCNAHYLRQREGRDMDAPIPYRRPNGSPAPLCRHPGCGQPRVAKCLCPLHYDRARRGTDMDAPKRVSDGTWRMNGYVMVRHNGENIRQHRLIMEQALGRRLAPWENVHHVNGVRDDNRLENLELWVNPQPQGQRAEDLARWVVETYPDLVKEVVG